MRPYNSRGLIGLLPGSYKMPEKIFLWIFTPASLFALFFSYGMVEEADPRQTKRGIDNPRRG